MDAPKLTYADLHWELLNILHSFDDEDLGKFMFLIATRDLDYHFRELLKNKDKAQIATALLKNFGIFTIDTMKRILEMMDDYLLLGELSQRCPYEGKEVLARCMKNLKCQLRKCFELLFEGVGASGRSVEFHKVYAQCQLIDRNSEEMFEEQKGGAGTYMMRGSRKPSEEVTICYQDIFNLTKPRRRGRDNKTVLTIGVAGVGKTVMTQKLILDWIEGKAIQEIQLLLPFTFRKLNEVEGSFSLVELLHKFFGETRELFNFQEMKLAFILDGLDECKFSLNFQNTRFFKDPNESASVEELLVNLIRGGLFPEAYVWITTRPGAANQIPETYISLVTEVRGFTDEQKDEFFKKRIPDEQQASAIIKHIKKSPTLYSICHIGLFCRILSQDLVHPNKKSTQLPLTLTQIYIKFLTIQAQVHSERCKGRTQADNPWTPESRKMVWSLAKLAFEQLMKRKLVFTCDDLREYGLDTEDIARYIVFKQGIKTQSHHFIIKAFRFFHQSFQVFLAALHAHHIFSKSGVNLLSGKPFCESPGSSTAKSSEKLTKLLQTIAITSPKCFYRCAVDLAIQEANGDLDLFLRFLLGLSLPTNQEQLQGLIRLTGKKKIIRKTVKYIKQQLNEDSMTSERRQNLLHDLNELNDHSLLEDTRKLLRDEDLSGKHISPAKWSALSFLLLSSDSDLEDFDLRKYQASEEALLGLLPVLKASTKANLTWCHLTEKICAPLASVIVSSSSLKHLDLSNNDLQDSGIELLCEGLKSAPCRLETLRFSGCMISERGGASLAAALSSSPSVLTELDLSYNHLGSSAELLKELQAPQGPLQTLRLDPAGEKFLIPGLRKYACEFALDPNTAHRRLVLSEDLLSVWSMDEDQSYPDNQDRFLNREQVLSSSGLRGRCYWEVDWTVGWVDVIVSYRRQRHSEQGEESGLGHNDQSWSLKIDGGGNCSVWHGDKVTKLPGTVGVSSGDVREGRVGVSLGDVSEGRVGESSGDNRERRGSVSSGDPSEETVSVSSDDISEDRVGVSSGDIREGSVSVSSGDVGEGSMSVSSGDVIEGRGSVSSGVVREGRGSVSSGDVREGRMGVSSGDIRESRVGVSSGEVREGRGSVSSGHVRESRVGVSSGEVREGRGSVSSGDVRVGRVVLSSGDVREGRVGVFLDWEGGVLSFYDVISVGRMRHLHTFNSTFTEELLPGFRLRESGSSVSVVKMNQD